MIRRACTTSLRHMRPRFGSYSRYERAFSDFKSKLSLDNLYPQSTIDQFDITKKFKYTDAIATQSEEQQPFSGYIPLDELNISYCRSSGPGGQNVNKANSKVEIRFNVDEAIWIPDWIKPKLKEEQDAKINKYSELIVTSEKTRTQSLNKADCLDKIRHMVFQAAVVPKQLSEEEIAKINKRIEKAKKQAVEMKRRRSMVKSNRRYSPD